jgi:hypothetical protein
LEQARLIAGYQKLPAASLVNLRSDDVPPKKNN